MLDIIVDQVQRLVTATTREYSANSIQLLDIRGMKSLEVLERLGLGIAKRPHEPRTRR